MTEELDELISAVEDLLAGLRQLADSDWLDERQRTAVRSAQRAGDSVWHADARVDEQLTAHLLLLAVAGAVDEAESVHEHLLPQMERVARLCRARDGAPPGASRPDATWSRADDEGAHRELDDAQARRKLSVLRDERNDLKAKLRTEREQLKRELRARRDQPATRAEHVWSHAHAAGEEHAGRKSRWVEDDIDPTETGGLA
jgi:hypothetical protein